MKTSKKTATKKDTLYAKTAFYLSLGFWIPLFNIGLCITSISIAIIALKKIYHEPEIYGGFGYAIAAIAISSASIILTIVGAIIYFTSDRICLSAICQDLIKA